MARAIFATVPEKLSPWKEDVLRAVCDVLGATEYPGLKGSEIDQVLAAAKAPDVVDPSAVNKRTRLYLALATRQNDTQASNSTVAAITNAMALGRHLDDPDRFHALRQRLDRALSLAGLYITDGGQVGRKSATARTLDEVEELAGRLTSELSRRKAHHDATRYCRTELLRQPTFHAVSEATKGLAQRLRDMSGSTADGGKLVDECLAGSPTPKIRINDYKTASEISEQKGIANLLKGVFGTFRNPTAHAPRDAWPVSEIDALDLFSTLSYLHRRLESSVITP